MRKKHQPRTRFFQMRVTDDDLQYLDDMRREEPDLPSRTEMARRILFPGARQHDHRVAGRFPDHKPGRP
jgi:hypothetical protein